MEESDGPEIRPTDTGLADDTPDEIKDFVLRNAVADKFSVMLKQKPDGGGKEQTLRSFSNWYPNVNTLGKEWGPGHYILVFSWRGLGISGKKEMITKEYEIDLPERAWLDEHEIYLEERARKRREKMTKEWEEKAAKDRIQGFGQAPAAPAPSELDVIRKALDAAKSLGVNIGGKVAEKPAKSFTEALADAVPLITALGAIVSPIAVALIQKQREKPDNTLTNTLLQHVLSKPQAEDPMKQMVPFLMGSIKQIFDLKESMEPPEKETIVERIIGKLAPMVPAVIAMASQGRAAVDANPMVKMARNSADFQTLANDPEALIIAVNKWDATYGFQQTNQILMVGGVERPAETAGNMATFPSKGFKADGSVDDGRDAKIADVVPGHDAEDDDAGM